MPQQDRGQCCISLFPSFLPSFVSSFFPFFLCSSCYITRARVALSSLCPLLGLTSDVTLSSISCVSVCLSFLFFPSFILSFSVSLVTSEVPELHLSLSVCLFLAHHSTGSRRRGLDISSIISLSLSPSLLSRSLSRFVSFCLRVCKYRFSSLHLFLCGRFFVLSLFPIIFPPLLLSRYKELGRFLEHMRRPCEWVYECWSICESHFCV